MSLFCAMRRYFIIFFFSPPECVDISQKQCPLWAANNQCIDNPCYMHKQSGLPFCLLFAFNFFCFCYCTDYSSLRKNWNATVSLTVDLQCYQIKVIHFQSHREQKNLSHFSMFSFLRMYGQS